MRAGSASVTPSSISASARSARSVASSCASCTLSFTPSTSASVGAITALTAHAVAHGHHDDVGQVVLALRVVVLQRGEPARAARCAGAAISPVLISRIARSLVFASFCSTMRTTLPAPSRTMRP